MERERVYTYSMHVDRKKAIAFSYFLFLLVVISFIFFIILWCIGAGKTNVGFHETLSYMLAHDQDVYIMYITWWSFYTLVSIIFMYIVFTVDICVIDNSNADVRHFQKAPCNCSKEAKELIYSLSTAIYLIFDFFKLFGLLMLWLFKTGVDGKSHAIFTGIAIVSSIIVQVFLFIRRMTSRVYISVYPYKLTVLLINFLCIIATIILTCMFLVSIDGALEFAMAILIGIDPFFQVIDYRYDAECYHILLQKEIKRDLNVRVVLKDDDDLNINTSSFHIKTTIGNRI